jgi:IclR family acetate operon transcriptional repressor
VSSLSLEERVAPLVRALRSELNETSSFMIRAGWDAEALVTEASDQALRYAIDPGTRKPLHGLAGGLVLLAGMSEAELADYFARSAREQLTPKTRVAEADLRADIAEIRQNGFCTARERATLGICGVAVPVRLGDRQIGVFSVAVPAVRFDPALEQRIRILLQRSADAIREA